MSDPTMIKIIVASRRRAGMSHEEHLKYFEAVHGAKVLAAGDEVLRHISKYVQNHVRDAVYNAGGAGYDSVGELWFSDGAALQSTMSHPYTVATIRPDEAKFSDPSSLLVSMVNEEQVRVRTPRNSRAKLMQFIYRHPGVDSGAFVNRWRAACSSLAESGEFDGAVRRLVLNHPLPAPPGAPSAGPTACDGITSLWFDRGSHLSAYQAYHRCLAETAAKLGSFVDPERSFVLFAEEVPIHPVAG